MVASDTEGYSIAKVCMMNNVKITILKGISDRPIQNSGYEEQFEVYEENAASHRDVVGGGRNNLMAIFR